MGFLRICFKRFHEYKENKEFFIMIFRVMIHARNANQKKSEKEFFIKNNYIKYIKQYSYKRINI